MKISVVVILAILAGTCAGRAQAPAPVPGHAQAQGPAKKGGSATVEDLKAKLAQQEALVNALESACPVSIQAKQRGMTQMVKTGKNEAPPERDYMPAPAQHIHLILRGFAKDKQVTGATVEARGRSAKPRMDNTQLVMGEGPAELRRTLDVTFHDDGDGTVSADLDLPSFTTVSAVQIQTVTYSDGSSWKLNSGNACTVAPDPLMLIAGR